MSTTIKEIATTIADSGSTGLETAAMQFEANSIEQRMLHHDLKAYRKETAGAHQWEPRESHVVYSDADMCVFQLTTDEDSPLVIDERNLNQDAPAWWLLGRDDLRECGFMLMEFPADNVDDRTAVTRSDVLDALDLDSWQPISREQAPELEVGQSYRLSGRLGIKRFDPDEWIEHHNDRGADIDWDELEQRDTTATRIASHLLTFEDAADLASTFDPMRDNDLPYGTAYIPDGAGIYIMSKHYRNRKLTLSGGIYAFRRISRCQHHTACAR